MSSWYPILQKFSGKWLEVNIAFTPTMNVWFLNVINTTCCFNEFLCFRWLFSKLQFLLVFEPKHRVSDPNVAGKFWPATTRCCTAA